MPEAIVLKVSKSALPTFHFTSYQMATYRIPRKNIEVTAILFLVDICNFQTKGHGMNKMMKSTARSEPDPA